MRLAILSLIALAGCSGLADARPAGVSFNFRARVFVPAPPPVAAVRVRASFAPAPVLAPAASFSYGFHAQRSFAPFVAAPAASYAAYSAPAAAVAPAGCSPQTAAQIAELRGQIEVLRLQQQLQQQLQVAQRQAAQPPP